MAAKEGHGRRNLKMSKNGNNYVNSAGEEKRASGGRECPAAGRTPCRHAQVAQVRLFTIRRNAYVMSESYHRSPCKIFSDACRKRKGRHATGE